MLFESSFLSGHETIQILAFVRWHLEISGGLNAVKCGVLAPLGVDVGRMESGRTPNNATFAEPTKPRADPLLRASLERALLDGLLLALCSS